MKWLACVTPFAAKIFWKILLIHTDILLISFGHYGHTRSAFLADIRIKVKEMQKYSFNTFEYTIDLFTIYKIYSCLELQLVFYISFLFLWENILPTVKTLEQNVYFSVSYHARRVRKIKSTNIQNRKWLFIIRINVLFFCFLFFYSVVIETFDLSTVEI